MNHSNLVLVAPVFESALKRQKLKEGSFALACDLSIRLRARAEMAHVFFPEKWSIDMSFKNVISFAFFQVHVVKSPISVRDLLHALIPSNRLFVGQKHRPGNMDETVEYLAKFPEHALQGRLLCINSMIFVGEDRPAVIVFERCGERIIPKALSCKDLFFEPGDRLIVRLGSKAS